MQLLEPIWESVLTCLRMAPILFGVLFAVEYFNHYHADRLKHFAERSRWVMPILAAGLGLIPGCSFGIFFATLFTTGLVSIGTLLAAMIATSDEALYVFLPLGYNPLPFLAIKFGLAVGSALLVDLFFWKHRHWLFPPKADGEDFCCRHHHHTQGFSDMALHAAKHTIRILSVVFVTLALVNSWIDAGGGEDTVQRWLGAANPFQPILAAVIGIVPNCSTSVILATLFTKHVLSFGAAIAGLSAASGEAILVLIAKGASRRQIAAVIGLLLGISVVAGYAIELIR